MRQKLYSKIYSGDECASNIYDLFMILIITISIIPLAFKTTNNAFIIIDKVSCAIFIADYILRFLTADFKLQRKTASFILYPFTPMAIIDLLSILPGLITINAGFRLFRLFRLFRAFRVLRVFKLFRYSKSIDLFVRVFKKQKDSLVTVGIIALAYIVISALVILNVEPESFNNYFDALYWATVSLTTVGYGDIYPVTTIGRIITMISSVMGIAIVAMPSGIVTAGIMDELQNK